MRKKGNGTTDVITVSAAAAINSVNPFTWFVWSYALTAGENSLGRFVDKGPQAWFISGVDTTLGIGAVLAGSIVLRTAVNSIVLNSDQALALSYQGDDGGPRAWRGSLN